jgi:DNA modification methylase
VNNLTLLQGDVREVLKSLPEKSVQCIVTSPPYYGLRDYGVDGQIGLEPTPEAYVANLVAVFRECWRVLRDDGTLWLNLGDSYWGGKGQSAQAWSTEHQERDTLQKSHHQISGMKETRPTDGKHETIKPKDLIGIPWMVAFALRADGWYLRSDIIWHKRSVMPESVRDRPTKAHEYIFLLTKSAKYYYDAEAVKEDGAQYEIERRRKELAKGLNTKHNVKEIPGKKNQGVTGAMNNLRRKQEAILTGKRNRRSVWTLSSRPFKGAHFATFPPELPEICILAGTSERGCCPECGAPWERDIEYKANYTQREEAHAPNSTPSKVDSSGWQPPTITMKGWRSTCAHALEPVPCVVLDPFNGAGTTGLVALKHRRGYVGIDLNAAYLEMTRERLAKVQTVW